MIMAHIMTLKSRFHVMSHDEGGRREPFATGYKGLMFINGTYVGSALVAICDEHGKNINFPLGGDFEGDLLLATGVAASVHAGAQFEFREGGFSKVIARGEIVDVLDVEPV